MAFIAAVRGGQVRSTSAPVRKSNVPSELKEYDRLGRERFRRRPEGWHFWDWREYRCHYAQAGDEGTPIVLVHGFGAHSWHWRYNMLPLAEEHRVFAPDLLGFGLSPKGIEQYSAELWGSQIAHFLENVVGAREPVNRVVLAGNSIGAVVALQVASTRPDLVKGLCLLNPAGRFNPETAERWKQRRGSSQTEPFPMQSGSTVGSPTPRCTFRFPFTPWEVLRSDVEYARNWFERAAASTTFFSLRFQIRQILNSIYQDKTRVDQDFIESVATPADEEGALEVFYRVAKSGPNSSETAYDMLGRLKVPLLLVWGMADPWIQPGKANVIQDQITDADFVPIEGAGHCPHDDRPEAFNEAIMAFARRI